MNTYKALIVDDEKDNIELLKIYLSRYCPNIEVIATATNVDEAIRQFIKFEPKLLLLDINLGKEDAFQFLDSIQNAKSEIVFISSHTEYGVKAVNYNVTAFITKPIKVDELKMAANKAIFNILRQNNYEKDEGDHEEYHAHLIAIPSTARIDLIHMDYIIYAEADGRYTIFHLTNGTTKIASRNLGEYEKQLNSKQFFRIHHRYIVNLKMMTNINKSGGNYCELSNNKSLPIAKRRQEELNKILKIKL